MTAENQNFEFYAGDYKVLTINVLGGAGQLIDISSSSAIAWVMKEHPWSSANVLSKSLGSGITITDGPGGIFEIVLAAADTEALLNDLDAEGKLYWHEAEVTDGSGLPSTVTTGWITLKRSGT